MSSSLYEAIYAEVSQHLPEDEAEFLADKLAFMHPDCVRELFAVIDNWEPTEEEQGLIPIPREYREP